MEILSVLGDVVQTAFLYLLFVILMLFSLVAVVMIAGCLLGFVCDFCVFFSEGSQYFVSQNKLQRALTKQKSKESV